jgi:hypothetical protein
MTRSIFALAAIAIAQAAAAQSTGSMTSPQFGSASAGGGPVGMLLPSSIQSASTAPTQPGYTITGDRPSRARTMSSAPRDDKVATKSVLGGVNDDLAAREGRTLK